MDRLSSRGSLFTTIDVLDEVGSTNDYLRDFVSEQVPRAAWAREQTAGKGRFGRSWHSPQGEGLYASFLVFPGWSASGSALLNRIACLSVVRALRSVSGGHLSLLIKQPNDILLNQKKLAGVLVELSTQGESIQWAIVGIGINLTQREFPFERPLWPATSLLLEGVTAPPPEELFEALLESFADFYVRCHQGESGQLEREFAAMLSMGCQDQ